MFTLVTGVPGAGKTLWTVNHLKDGVKYPDSQEKRPIFYYGIPDLSPDLGWTLLDNPKLWFEQVPDGAIVVIDEVQEHFPVRDHRQAVPAGLTAIERHRHRGLDLFWLTQHPSLLDHHARRLVGQHCHLLRNFGAPFSVLYRANELIGDTQDYRLLKKAEKSVFRYPKNTFGLYKSSELHTHKFRIPKPVFILFALLVVVVLSVMFFAKNILFKDSKPVDLSTFSPSSLPAGVSVPPAPAGAITLQSLTPLIPNVPASSPAYQEGWRPQSVPVVSSCISDGTNCKCYTPQATPVAVSVDFCTNAVLNGLPFDHTLPDPRLAQNSDQHDKKAIR